MIREGSKDYERRHGNAPGPYMLRPGPMENLESLYHQKDHSVSVADLFKVSIPATWLRIRI